MMSGSPAYKTASTVTQIISTLKDLREGNGKSSSSYSGGAGLHFFFFDIVFLYKRMNQG